MLLRTIISVFAKAIYQKEYVILKEKLQSAYCESLMTDIVRNYMLEKLLVSGEDHRFKYHIGFDIFAIIRAFRNRIVYKKHEGASTIEQQIVRVLSGDFQKTAKRKIKEIFLSTTLNEIIPRKDTPLVYLHIAYYGSNMNGLRQVYDRFGIPVKFSISKETAAGIVARIKYPEPKLYSKKRAEQIALRTKHLLKLYIKHSESKLIKIHDYYT